MVSGGDNVQKAIDAMFAARNHSRNRSVCTGSTVQKVVRRDDWTNAAGEFVFQD